MMKEDRLVEKQNTFQFCTDLALPRQQSITLTNIDRAATSPMVTVPITLQIIENHKSLIIIITAQTGS